MARDEYTDYSCSTSVERLTRDVETLLRSWHLAGSDRHVSFSEQATARHIHPSSSLPIDAKENKDGHQTDTNVASGEKRTDLKSDDSPSYSSRHWSSRTESSPSVMMSEGQHRPTTPARLIRSESLSWTVSWSDTNECVPLRLALWDGPSRQKSNHDALLPLSLRRIPFSRVPTDIFGDFSTLFGIGQHVTLTLDNPHASHHTTNDVNLEEDWISLACAVLDRHDHRSSPWTLISILSSLLQTALNCAVANCQSRIPVFGWWGVYDLARDAHQDHRYLQLFPPWMASKSSADRIVSAATRQRQQQGLSSFFRKADRNRNEKRSQSVNRHYIAPVLAAKVSLDEESDAAFWVGVLPGRNLAADSRLTVWGQMLLRHCPPSTNSVVLCGARHIYTYLKPTKSLFPRHQASGDGSNMTSDEDEQSRTANGKDSLNEPALLEEYRLQCRQYTLSLLERAVNVSREEPLWGPSDDPVASVHCTVTWNGQPSEDDDSASEPLLSLPLRIRSQQVMTRQDWIDMEDSVERTLLDPMIASSFAVRIHWDKETSVTSLAANQRCVLASLIRAATLPSSILLQHLTNESVVDDWGADVDEHAATNIMDHVQVNVLTRHLVEAMDWTSIGDHMIEPWEAKKILNMIFDGTMTLGYPTPLPKVFDRDEYSKDDLFSPLLRAAPVGRLLSMLFVHMSRLRGPSSMAVVWTMFVRDLRGRWDRRESLPNMTYVPGLDPPPESLITKRCVSSIGVEAEYSSFVHSSEPDPDDTYCLIGQKLQVFNVGIECTIAAEMLEADNIRKLERDEMRSKLTIVNREGEEGAIRDEVKRPVDIAPIKPSERTSPLACAGEEPLHKRLDVRSTPPDNTFGVSEERSLDESQTSDSSKQDFYDAVDDNENTVSEETPVCDASLVATEHTDHMSLRPARHGARCPVHGASLVSSGDQLFAPYLHRPFPLTDDVVLERRMMLSSGRTNDLKSSSVGIQEQIEISQRLQKPKLLSDMCAFKAANPGAVFRDFTSWYGNPGSPLDDYSEGLYSDPRQALLSAKQSIAKKLDDATQAMNVLNATRDFWSDTWDEARPLQATEQQPLFDSSSMVEMTLDNFETMHPANLLNQILAVSLSSSYSILVSAARDTLHVGVVRAAVQQLREKTELALELLSRDATLGAISSFHDDAHDRTERGPRHASLEAIQACDGVCDAMGTAEAAICRATTLLDKFPKQYQVVHDMLTRPEHDTVMLNNAQGRNGILSAIQRQGQTTDSLPVPSLREYVLRNTEEESPCQLSVRFGNEGAFHGIDADGGVLVCLTKCNSDS